jgi:hypothetical protein
MKSFFNKYIKTIFKTEHSRFVMLTGLKVSGISILINLVVYGFLFEMMRLNYAFFKANNFPELTDQSLYYDYLLTEVTDNFGAFFAFHIFLFFIGCYVGWLILRPFKDMADYCERAIENPNTIYKVEDFSTYSLLTRFSEFFFEFLRESRIRGELSVHSIPPQYAKIHRPTADKIFMLHFGLLLILIAVCSSVFTIENSTNIFNNMIELSEKTLLSSQVSSKFFSEQSFVINDTVWLSVVLIVISYLALGIHLYEKVSGAAFGIFSTMRSFMKGNHSSRVHLLGYAHIREYTRKINKYLDYVHNIINKDRPRG